MFIHVLERQEIETDKPHENSFLSPKSRFSHKLRSEPSLLSPSDYPSTSKVPIVCLQGESLPMDLFTFRPGLGSSDIWSVVQLDCIPSEGERSSSSSLSGRVSARTSESCDSLRADCASSSSSVFSGLECKYSKVPTIPLSEHRLSGHNLEHDILSNVVTFEQSGFIKKNRLQLLYQNPHWSLRIAQELIGVLNFAAFVVPLGRLHLRRIQLASRQLHQLHPRQIVPIPQQALKEMGWWVE